MLIINTNLPENPLDLVIDFTDNKSLSFYVIRWHLDRVEMQEKVRSDSFISSVISWRRYINYDKVASITFYQFVF